MGPLGVDLKPHGSGAHFDNECTGCHQPVKGNDYVYTLPLTRARSTRQETVKNRAAALPATLPYEPLRWTPITMFVDRKSYTMSTLYGNEAAIASLHARSRSSDAPNYDPGTVLALVTWVQRDDPHWFGGKIPYSPASVEIVTVGPQNTFSYRRLDGASRAEAHPLSSMTAQRTSFLINLKPASLP
jgi:hypothetical protein